MTTTLTDPTAAFAATVDHAIRLHEKASALMEQAAASLAVAASLADRGDVPHDAIVAAVGRLRAADVTGRGVLTIGRDAPAAQPGDRFTRQRGCAERWPKAPAWVYLLFAGDRLLYVGATERPAARMGAHRARGWDRVDLVACADRAAALRLEGDLIFHLRPEQNRADTVTRRFVP